MKKFKCFLSLLALVSLIPVMQSCDDDGYSIGDFSWDWATVRTTGGGGYYLEGDHWGIIEPVATSIPWFKPVDGERVVSFFNPLADMADNKGVQVKMEGIREILTKEVEEMTDENVEEFGDDPIVIYQGDMWLGGKFLNIIFHQNLPYSEKHRISLVQNKTTGESEPGEPDGETVKTSGTAETPETPEVPETPDVDEDGYVHLELRYNTYDDVTDYWGWGRVSYNLEKFYPTSGEEGDIPMKGFKVTINSEENGKGTVVVLDFEHPVGVPEKAKDVHTTSSVK